VRISLGALPLGILSHWGGSTRLVAAPALQFLQAQRPLAALAALDPGGIGTDTGLTAAPLAGGFLLAFQVGEPPSSRLAEQALLLAARRAPPGSIEQEALAAEVLRQPHLGGVGGGEALAAGRQPVGCRLWDLGHLGRRRRRRAAGRQSENSHEQEGKGVAPAALPGEVDRGRRHRQVSPLRSSKS